MLLFGRFKDLEAKINGLQLERDACILQIRENHDIHAAEIKSMRTALDESNEKNLREVHRLDRLARIEQNLISLYMDMKDRCDEDQQKPEDREKEEKDLQKMDALDVIDLLRATLKYLKEFKDDFENELRSTATRKKSAQELQIVDLRRQLQDMERKVHRSKVDVASMRAECLAREDERQKRMAENEKRMAATLTDKQDMERKLHLKCEEADMLNAIVRQLQEDNRKKDVQLTHAAQRESNMKNLEMQHASEMQKLQARFQHNVSLFGKELQRLTKMDVENKHLKERLRTSTTQLVSYKTNFRISKDKEADEKSKRMEQVVEKQTEENKELQRSLRHIQVQLESSQKNRSALKTEYDKLAGCATVVQQRFDDQSRKGSNDSEWTKYSDEAPYLVEMLKAELKEKEKENAELVNKLRRLLEKQHSKHAPTRTDVKEIDQELLALKLKIGAVKGLSKEASAGVHSVTDLVLKTAAVTIEDEPTSTANQRPLSRSTSARPRNRSLSASFMTLRPSSSTLLIDPSQRRLSRPASALSLSRSASSISLLKKTLNAELPSPKDTGPRTIIRVGSRRPASAGHLGSFANLLKEKEQQQHHHHQSQEITQEEGL